MTWLLPNSNLIFIHIPKTGGTSITKSLRDSGYIIEPPEFNKKDLEKLLPDIKRMPTHSKISWYKTIGLELDKYRFFAQVRNPYTRIVSLYYFIRQQDKSRIEGHVNPRNFRRDIDFYKRRYEFYDKMSFEQFVINFTNEVTRKNIFDEWVVEKTSQIEYGWTPQYLWLKGGDVSVFKLEEVDKTIEFLNNQGIKFIYKHHKKSKAVKDLNNDYMGHYTNNTKKLVCEHFDEDFTRFNYSR